MERTFLAWNIENWVTVLLMAALGYLLLAIVVQAIGGWMGSGNTAPPTVQSGN